ncbi:MAG: class III extradiol dioxygenase subunit B-like domain-containing protein [Patescibacteria group bacterium]|nr:MEMO1 family protein [Patescibacteria group bacterium]
MLVFSGIMPHPPVAVPGIGEKDSLGQIKATIRTMKDMGRELKASGAGTVFLISPHAFLERDRFLLNGVKQLCGDLSQFGFGRDFCFKNELEIVGKIERKVRERGLPVETYQGELDHGALVPLYYLGSKAEFSLVQASICFLSQKTHFEYGQTLGRILKKSPKKIAVVASGDLSHRITRDAPAGYSPRGSEFDKTLIDFLERGDAKEVINFNPELREEAGECGLNPILVLLGIMDGAGLDWKFEKLSYEAPFGVGYLVGRLKLAARKA